MRLINWSYDHPTLTGLCMAALMCLTVSAVVLLLLWLFPSTAPHCDTGTPLFEFYSTGKVSGYRFVGCKLP